MADMRYFPAEEFERRRARVRRAMTALELDALLISAPENVYYLTGLDHMGYFAYELLVLLPSGTPKLVTRAMERATIRDQVPDVEHVPYSDGIEPLPPPRDREEDLVLAKPRGVGEVGGVQPWSMSLGVVTRKPGRAAADLSMQVRVTVEALKDAGVTRGRVGMEKNSSFLPVRIAEGIQGALPEVAWIDASGVVGDCRMIQSERELECTRQAAAVSDAMMLAAIAAAGPGVAPRDVMAALYDAMFRRGGTYPGFVPLVRATRTLDHEHGTWQAEELQRGDLLFLEMAGCVRRYHAPMGRLVFIGETPPSAYDVNRVCADAMHAAAGRIGPGVKACEVYAAWQDVLNKVGLDYYRRHHCGYSVGIGFPPSWSGSGTPLGLRADSQMELKPGMVFHLMSWLLRTGRGDSFLSDTCIVTENGCEILTNVARDVIVRN